MLEEIAGWIQLAMFMSVLSISGLIFVFRRFPAQKGASLGQWWARVQQAIGLVAVDGLDQALHRAGLLAIGGCFLMMATTQRAGDALGMAVVYYLFGIPVFTVLRVLHLADLSREELAARLSALQDEPRRPKRRRRGR